MAGRGGLAGPESAASACLAPSPAELVTHAPSDTPATTANSEAKRSAAYRRLSIIRVLGRVTSIRPNDCGLARIGSSRRQTTCATRATLPDLGPHVKGEAGGACNPLRTPAVLALPGR